MKLIILDRDGVINHDSDDYIKSEDEWQPIEGSLQAIGRLCQAGYTVAIATNQSGIARGYYDVSALHAMHKKMSRLLEQYGGNIEAIFFCPHGPKDDCDCRKPRPGMLKDIALRYQCGLTDVAFIGDTISDIRTARAAGARPILVRTGKGERTLDAMDAKELENIPVYDDLAAATQAILLEDDFE
jgi:D-glycero-D-manno-heptose 1,7-bisphosphate phosphatase